MAAGKLGEGSAVVRRRLRERETGCEGRGCRRLGCSDERAPPPPRPAPALASRHLPPPALLMLLLADMDVVNQVRAPAPWTEPGACWNPDSFGPPTRRGGGQGSRDRVTGAGAWGGLQQARGGRKVEKKECALCRIEDCPHCRRGGLQSPIRIVGGGREGISGGRKRAKG